MRRVITVLAVAALFATAAFPAAARAGQIWTDGDGDGLPDQGPFLALPGTNVTVDVWVDTQSYAFTFFQCWVERAPGLRYVSGSVLIPCDVRWPIDTFTNPSRTGISGGEFPNRQGVIALGRLVYRVESLGSCCVRPIVDFGDAPYSILGNNAQGSYRLFQYASGTCWQQTAAAEPTNWGKVKGIYQ